MFHVHRRLAKKKITLYHTISQHSNEPYTHVSHKYALISFQCLHTVQSHAFFTLAKKVPCCKFRFRLDFAASFCSPPRKTWTILYHTQIQFIDVSKMCMCRSPGPLWIFSVSSTDYVNYVTNWKDFPSSIVSSTISLFPSVQQPFFEIMNEIFSSPLNIYIYIRPFQIKSANLWSV